MRAGMITGRVRKQEQPERWITVRGARLSLQKQDEWRTIHGHKVRVRPKYLGQPAERWSEQRGEHGLSYTAYLRFQRQLQDAEWEPIPGMGIQHYTEGGEPKGKISGLILTMRHKPTGLIRDFWNAGRVKDVLRSGWRPTYHELHPMKPGERLA